MRTLIACLLLVASTGVAAADFDLRGDAIAVFNLAGAIRAEAGGGDVIQASVTLEGPDAAELDVDVIEANVRGRRMQTLVVRYPGRDVVYAGADDGGRGRTEVRVAGDGTFHRSTGRRVRVRRSGAGTEAHASILLRVPPGRLVNLYQAVGSIEVADVTSDLYLDTYRGTIDARRVNGDVIADTGAGRVRLEGVRGSTVEADTGSGAVTLIDVDAQDVRADTGSGSVSMRRVTAQRVVADTGSGGVAMRGVSADTVRADTGSGGVELEYTGEGGDARVDTGSGAVRVTLPRGLGLALKVDTGSGGITTRLDDITVRRSEDDELVATRGDGALRLVIDTGSGSVSVSE